MGGKRETGGFMPNGKRGHRNERGIGRDCLGRLWLSEVVYKESRLLARASLDAKLDGVLL